MTNKKEWKEYFITYDKFVKKIIQYVRQVLNYVDMPVKKLFQQITFPWSDYFIIIRFTPSIING
jgi:hypothetical protein